MLSSVAGVFNIIPKEEIDTYNTVAGEAIAVDGFPGISKVLNPKGAIGGTTGMMDKPTTINVVEIPADTTYIFETQTSTTINKN